MSIHAMIIINPSSGGEKSLQFEREIKDRLIEQSYEVIIRKTEKKNDAKKFAEDACDQKMELISVLGGDGTISEVINGIAEQEHRPKLHIIPLGTVNNFARALEIPLKPSKAIDTIQNKQERKIDVGKMNKLYFMNLLNIGAVAEATYQVTSEQKSKLGSFAYFLEGVKKFSERELIPTTITTDHNSEKIDAMLILVAVTDTVAGIKNIIKEGDVKDGYLHVFAFKEVTNLEGISILKNLINGSLKEQEQIKYWKTKSVHIDTDPEKTVNIDGDEGGKTPLQIEILEKHITILK